jgi:hypothetical protein
MGTQAPRRGTLRAADAPVRPPPRPPSFHTLPHWPQITGCAKDLGECRRYYQRYRLCPEHLNLSCLVINGVPSRFCQKCLHFHELSAFDADKRCALPALPALPVLPVLPALPALPVVAIIHACCSQQGAR